MSEYPWGPCELQADAANLMRRLRLEHGSARAALDAWTRIDAKQRASLKGMLMHPMVWEAAGKMLQGVVDAEARS